LVGGDERFVVADCQHPNLVDRDPMSLDRFIEQTGLSPCDEMAIQEKKDFLRTVNICGRHHVQRSEVARFQRSCFSRGILEALQSPIAQVERKQSVSHRFYRSSHLRLNCAECASFC
jgi:hypothetical protein